LIIKWKCEKNDSVKLSLLKHSISENGGKEGHPKRKNCITLLIHHMG